MLNTGRVRDQWHTMTRTGYSPRLSAHLAEPFAELHPTDAAARGIADADIVELANAYGRVRVRALLTGRQRAGSVFVPMHWSGPFASAARVDSLVAPRVDPVSGQPASKSAPVGVRRAAMGSHGFALLAARPEGRARRGEDTARPRLEPPGPPLDDDYWAIAPCPGGWRVEFADAATPPESAGRWLERLRRLPLPEGTGPEGIVLSTAEDARRGAFHAALFAGPRLLAVLHVGRAPVDASRSFCAELLARTHDTPAARQAVLAGRAAADVPDQGAIVCSCFGVGERRILETARAERSCRSVAAIGERLGAGTNCGSCRGEIAALLRTRLAEDVRGGGGSDVEAEVHDVALAHDVLLAL